MDSGNTKKLLAVVGGPLFVFVIFFLLLWRPKYADLGRYREELSKKEAELMQLERDASDWPDTITRGMLNEYEAELERIWELIPTKEEIAILLDEIQDHARSSELEIISLSRVSKTRANIAETSKGNKYVRVPYVITLGGNYFGLIRFLRRLEDSRRLVTITDIKVNAASGRYFVQANLQFNIFFSRVGVETS